MTLALRLREAMTERHIGYRRLAVMSGVSHSTIRHLARDERKLGGTTCTLAQLAQALGISPAWLAFGLGERDL